MNWLNGSRIAIILGLIGFALPWVSFPTASGLIALTPLPNWLSMAGGVFSQNWMTGLELEGSNDDFLLAGAAVTAILLCIALRVSFSTITTKSTSIYTGRFVVASTVTCLLRT